MPVSSFFSQIADKAQSAINQTPLAAHIPGASPPPDQPSANQAAAQGGPRSHTFESLQHQLRNIGQQYTSTTPLQRVITTEKGVALDLDSLARDAKAQSKELYTWGQAEGADLKDGERDRCDLSKRRPLMQPLSFHSDRSSGIS